MPYPTYRYEIVFERDGDLDTSYGMVAAKNEADAARHVAESVGNVYRHLRVYPCNENGFMLCNYKDDYNFAVRNGKEFKELKAKEKAYYWRVHYRDNIGTATEEGYVRGSGAVEAFGKVAEDYGNVEILEIDIWEEDERNFEKF